MVRLAGGPTREARLVSHVLPIPDARLMPAYLTTLCGARFHPGEFDLLDQILGVPCERCFAESATYRRPVPSWRASGRARLRRALPGRARR